MEGMNKDLATEIAEFKGYGTPSTTASDSTSNVSDSSPVYRIIEKGQNFGERYMYATKMPDGEKKRKFLPLRHASTSSNSDTETKWTQDQHRMQDPLQRYGICCRRCINWQTLPQLPNYNSHHSYPASNSTTYNLLFPSPVYRSVYSTQQLLFKTLISTKSSQGVYLWSCLHI